MDLAHAYTAVLEEAEEEGKGADFTKKLIAYMKSRGHLSLLPRITRLLSRRERKSDAPYITVAKEHDLKTFDKKIQEALRELGASQKKPLHIIDARAVGGFAVRANA